VSLNLLVGVVLLGAAVPLRRTPVLALLAALAGLLWFVGDSVGPLVFAHRAPLTHLLLLYPSRHFRSRWPRWTAGIVWVVSFSYPIAALEEVTVLTFLVLVLTCVGPGPVRALRPSALVAKKWSGSGLGRARGRCSRSGSRRPG